MSWEQNLKPIPPVGDMEIRICHHEGYIDGLSMGDGARELIQAGLKITEIDYDMMDRTPDDLGPGAEIFKTTEEGETCIIQDI